MRRLRLCLVVSLVLLCGQAVPDTITGVPDIVDGDGLSFSGIHVRLEGIDAPELRQTCRQGDTIYRCGMIARDVLEALVDDRVVTCRISGRDVYDRLLGSCTTGDLDLNRIMVLEGWAVVDPRYSQLYAQDEAAAKAAGSGMHGGTFDPPWRWRKLRSEL